MIPDELLSAVIPGVDHCADGSHRCEHECHNIVGGSYTCSCPVGFSLNSNGYSCDGMFNITYIRECVSTSLPM